MAPIWGALWGWESERKECSLHLALTGFPSSWSLPWVTVTQSPGCREVSRASHMGLLECRLGARLYNFGPITPIGCPPCATPWGHKAE